MTVLKTDKSANVAPIRGDDGLPAKLTARATFSFVAQSDDQAPEMSITSTAPTPLGQPVAKTGVDLSGKKKVIFFVGRGKTGKTTLIRWMSETALAGDGSFLMADMDPTNDTFSKYIEGVARPTEAGDPILALKWLDALLQHAMNTGMSVMVDLGGGDTTLRRLVAQLPDLVSMFDTAGFAVIVFYTVGPQEEGLTPLATMEGLGLQPAATAIVLNEGYSVTENEMRDFAALKLAQFKVPRKIVFLLEIPKGATGKMQRIGLAEKLGL